MKSEEVFCVKVVKPRKYICQEYRSKSGALEIVLQRCLQQQQEQQSLLPDFRSKEGRLFFYINYVYHF